MRRLYGGLVALGFVCHAATANAALWCAQRLVVHEWGVQVFDGSGARRSTAQSLLPPWFHRQGPADGAALPARVSDLPPDTGIRKLPVVHFYAPDAPREAIPFSVGVGFLQGTARVWFPQVDVWRTADAANSPAAAAIRSGLVGARQQLSAMGPRPTLPDDPTRQLQWSQLQLTTQATAAPQATTESWVGRAREIAGALWVLHGAEADRFLFYEAETRERVALAITRGSGWSPAKREYVLLNTGVDPLHEVRITHREGATVWVAYAAEIAAGKSVTMGLLPDVPAASREALRSRWIESAPSTTQAREGGCVMNRDPAVPFEKTLGHRLFAAELDLLMSVWAGEIFDRPGTTITYREDVRYLDRMMPLSLFTSMNYYVELNRFSLAIWQNVVLP